MKTETLVSVRKQALHSPAWPETDSQRKVELMPKDQTPLPKSTDSATHVTQGATTWIDAISSGMDTWAKSSTALLSGMRGMAQTMQQFSQSRLHENIDACKSLSACRNPADLAGHQRAYFETAMGQYSKHAQDMSEQTSAMIAAAASHSAPDT